ncbi:MAG TPA: hypothetical protein VJ719_01970, partial [Chthoniobacterales bacterium]|nr:hypothetical protein [Chthoniobacterales bacterium]
MATNKMSIWTFYLFGWPGVTVLLTAVCTSTQRIVSVVADRFVAARLPAAARLAAANSNPEAGGKRSRLLKTNSHWRQIKCPYGQFICLVGQG